MDESSILLVYASLSAPLLAATIYFSLFWPQTPGRAARESFGLASELSFWTTITSLPVPIPETPQSVAIWLVCIAVAAFAGYGAALYLSSVRVGGKRELLMVAGIGLLGSFINVWSLPNLNTDIYDYILTGRVAAVYGENPYAIAAAEFADDPIYPFASNRYSEVVGDKLPVWMVLNVFLARISGDDPVTNVLTYRLALFLFSACNLLLVILTLNAIRPQGKVTGAVLYAWNPIVLLLAQSKTDTLMAFFVLLAAWLFATRRRWSLAFTSIVLSILVKLITLPLAAVLILRSIRLRRWSELWRGLLSAGVLLGLGGILLLLSKPALLFNYLLWLEAMGPFESTIISRLILIGFVVLLMIVAFAQDGSDRRLFIGWSVVMLYFIFLIGDYRRAWYLITAVAVIAVAANSYLHFLVWASSLFSFVLNFWNPTFTPEFPSPGAGNIPRAWVLLAFAGILIAFLAALRVRKQVY